MHRSLFCCKRKWHGDWMGEASSLLKKAHPNWPNLKATSMLKPINQPTANMNHALEGILFVAKRKKMKNFLVLMVAMVLAGCAAKVVRQQDLDAWVGMPIEALDTHSLFITVPLYKTRTESGIEIRNYANGKSSESCYSNGGAIRNPSGKYVSASTFTQCSSDRVVCNNIFYIKDGKVLEYAPTGQCMTDDTVRPQKRYLELIKK